ncbi:MAG: peptidoglycan-binding protein, partial [Alphaproteobacteria bacterium]|nr:peptidoglycan-binding protein [Alphaproteobacteria bacterium]
MSEDGARPGHQGQDPGGGAGHLKFRRRARRGRARQSGRRGRLAGHGADRLLIIANATAFQSGRHPAPLVATRDRASPPAQVAPAAPDRATLQAQKLVRDIQVELRRLHMYEGPLDGLKGPATERGVRAYQRARGLAETGRVNEALMARLALDTGDGVNGPDAPPLPPVPPASVPGASSAPPSVTPSALPSAAL